MIYDRCRNFALLYSLPCFFLFEKNLIFNLIFNLNIKFFFPSSVITARIKTVVLTHVLCWCIFRICGKFDRKGIVDYIQAYSGEITLCYLTVVKTIFLLPYVTVLYHWQRFLSTISITCIFIGRSDVNRWSMGSEWGSGLSKPSCFMTGM